MLKLKGNLIWLLLYALAFLSCSHMPQTYPPPNISMYEKLEQPQSIQPLIAEENKQMSPGTNQNKPEKIQELLQENDSNNYNEYTIGMTEECPEEKNGIDETVSIYTLPIENNNKTREYIDKALGKNRTYYISVLNRFEKVRPKMEAILEEQGLPKDLAYVAFVESGGNPHALSPSGAGGYWQFLPGTARLYGLKIDRWVDERKDLEKSTRAAAKYLNQLNNMFGDWLLACAAYNAGEMAIDRILKKNDHVKTFWDISPDMIYKYETIAFVPKILAAVQIGRNRDKYDIPLAIDPEPICYDTVTINSYTTFEQIADLTGYSMSSIAVLNPELTRRCTPPYAKDYKLKVPAGTGELVASSLKSNKNQAVQYVSYSVQKGDTLFSIAKKHHISTEEISAFNKIGKKDRLPAGTILIIPEDIYLKQSEKRVLASKDFRTHKNSQPQEEVAEADSNADTGIVKKKIAYTSIPAIKKTPRLIRYNVKKGDTIWKISKHYEVKEEDVKKWNQLNSASSIRPGDKLTIYLKQKK
jgi:membrane-bound lytic murein transglycosylase D